MVQHALVEVEAADRLGFDYVWDGVARILAAVGSRSRVGARWSNSLPGNPQCRSNTTPSTIARAGQQSSGYNLRAKVEAAIGRYKRVIGDTLRSRTDKTEATEIAVAAAALKRTLAFRRPNYVWIA